MNYNRYIDNRNKPLIDYIIKNKFCIKVIHSHKGTWTFHLKGSLIVIGVKQSKYPISCFTHELLHAEIQIRGYKKLKYGKSSLFPNADLVTIMDALDQELQHHKMFQRFIELGFPSNEFYHDNDIEVLSKLDKFLKNGHHDLLSVLLRYFTVIAPGGAIESERLDFYKEQLKTINNNAFRERLNVIDEIFIQWTKSESLDAESYIKNYFNNIGRPSKTWFGYGTPNEFPNNGFFVDEVFSL